MLSAGFEIPAETPDEVLLACCDVPKITLLDQLC
jgi:hypothetical protein